MQRTAGRWRSRSEEHTSELQSHLNLVCRLLLEKKNTETLQYVTGGDPNRAGVEPLTHQIDAPARRLARARAQRKHPRIPGCMPPHTVPPSPARLLLYQVRGMNNSLVSRLPHTNVVGPPSLRYSAFQPLPYSVPNASVFSSPV